MTKSSVNASHDTSALKNEGHPVTWGQALQWGERQLLEGSPSSKADVQRLLTDQTAIGMLDIYQYLDRPLTDAECLRFEQQIHLRLQGMPIAYITGRQDFWQHSFFVNEDVLIPRPETEQLVDWLLARGQANQSILELGTGSGAVILSIAKANPELTCWAVDASAPALAVARRNQRRLGVHRVTWLQSNWFAALPNDLLFDYMVSNPPYLAENDCHLGAGDVRFEPKGALVAGATGLEAYERLLAQGQAHLRAGGQFCLEHGAKQAAELRTIFARYGWCGIATIKDEQGLERITFASKPI